LKAATLQTHSSIRIHTGTYREVITIKQSHVRFEGDVKILQKFVIVFNKSHGAADGI